MAYEIGTTYGGMAALSALDEPVSDPKSNFWPYSQYITLGDGTVRGLGWARAEWRWSTLPTRAQRDQLKAFCAGASAEVYIKTRSNDTADTFTTYTCVMIWPEDEDKFYSQRRDFVVQFTNLVEYSP